MNNIKDYRGKELLWYIIAQIILIVIFQEPRFLESNFCEWRDLLVQILSSTLVSSTICIYAFIFDSMFGDGLKYRLLYLWMKRPGEVVFTNIRDKHRDFRYTREKALVNYKTVYEQMPPERKSRRAYENEQWYHIYSRYRDVPMISSSHRDYLLCRDVYFATIVITILYVLVILFLKSISISWYLIAFEFILLVVSNIAARQRAKRYVANVIAYDLQESPKVLYAV